MNIFWIILGVIAAATWVISNFYTAKMSSAKEMHQNFIHGQCLVGRIFANIFYAPAWLLKGIRFIVVATIK